MLTFTFRAPEVFLLLFTFLAVLSFAFTIWACFDIARQPFKKESDKVVWILLSIFIAPIGAIVYYIKRDDLIAGPPQPTQRS